MAGVARLRAQGQAAEEIARRELDDDFDALIAPAAPTAAAPLESVPIAPAGEGAGRDAGVAPGPRPTRSARRRREVARVEAPDALAAFMSREHTRGLSAALPADLDLRLAAHERKTARAGEGDRVTRIAIVEQAIEALPSDSDELCEALGAVAAQLGLGTPARAFSVRVKPAVVERLSDLSLQLYREKGLRKVTNRALVVAALSLYLGIDEI